MKRKITGIIAKKENVSCLVISADMCAPSGNDKELIKK